MVIYIRFRRKTCEASSTSSSISLTRIDSLPDGVLQFILLKLSNAKDVASCNCVSKKWKALMRYRKTLCFPHGIFDNLTGPQTPDSIVMQMVSSVSQLEKLVVSCPFTGAGLASWLLTVGSSLKILELHYLVAVDESLANLECIRFARNLRFLCLWRVIMTRTPNWEVFQKLRELEIHGATLTDSVLMNVLRATPKLTRFVLVGCEGLLTVCIEHLELRHCQFCVSSNASCSLTLKSPKIQYLMVVGCDSIRVDNTNCLKTLYIGCRTRIVNVVELGDNLMALESLCVKGFRWHSEVISKLLQVATQVKNLVVEIFWICDNDLRPVHFPEIDFVDFFRTHRELKYLRIIGGMIDALCNNHMTTIKNVDSSFVIPCLEEVFITLITSPPQPSLAKKITKLVESLVKYGNKLKKINIDVMSREMEDAALDFSQEIRRLFRDSTTECRVFLEVHNLPPNA